MMRASSLLAAAALSVVMTSAWAQTPGAPAGAINSATEPQGTTRDYVSPSDIKGLADLVDTKRMLEGRNLVSPSVAKGRSLAMLGALHVSCRLTDAKSIGAGTRVVDGKPVQIGLYETSCGNGMGYLLTMQGRSMASGISCFEAGAAPSGGGAHAGGADLRCQLPANADLDAMATTVMRIAGTSCVARGVRWLGHSAAPDFDYTDVACGDGQEYVLRTPAPGSKGSIGVLSCQAASRLGASCQLAAGSSGATAQTGSAASGKAAPGAQTHPDLRWFKDALAKYGFACDVKNARLIGRESIKRRWVVELQCAQHPQGVIAFVPSAGDTLGKFEPIDCDTAAARHLQCEFPHAK